MVATTTSPSPSGTEVSSTAPGPGKAHTTEALTQITHRSDLSLLYQILRVVIRPLRPHLVAFGDPYPAGSPQIAKRPHTHYSVQIAERRLSVASSPDFPLPQADPATKTQHLWVYDFESKRLPSKSSSSPPQQKWYTHSIYYFAGGGFQSPPSGEHWKLCARLARDLVDHRVRVVLVSYPLAPNSRAKDSLPLLRKWLVDALIEASSNGEETVSLMGDSSGGNICLSLGFWWASRVQRIRQRSGDKSAEDNDFRALKTLRGLFVMSPPCDFRNTNPAIADADKLDPVLSRGLTDSAAEEWCKDWTEDPTNADPRVVDFRQGQGHGQGQERVKVEGKSDPALSPNLQTPEAWEALRESGLVIDGIIGTADVLAPDGQLFMERCKEEKIKGQWLVWEKQMHCFPLTVCYGLKEGREGFEWAKQRLRAF